MSKFFGIIKNKYSSMPLTMRAVVWFTICNFALKGLGFICMPLYTRVLSSKEYGRMSVLTSYETILNIFATFEIYLGAYQRGILKFSDDQKTFRLSIDLISNIITIIFAVIVMIFHKAFVGFTDMPISLFLVMTVYYLFNTPYMCWITKKRFDYDYKVVVAVTLIMALTSNLLPLLTVQIFGRTAYVKVLSTILISSLFCLPFWIRDFDISCILKNKDKVLEYIKYALVFQFPLVFHSLSYYILNQSDRVMIDKLSNSSNVAYYSVAYSFAMVINIIQNSMNQVLKPWRYQKLDRQDFRSVKDISNVLVAVVGGCIMLFMLVVPEVFKLAMPSSYNDALSVIPPVTTGVFFLFLYTIFVDIESYYGKTSYIAYVSVFSAGLNVLLNYLGMKFFSYKVCAYTTLICYIIMSFLHFLFMLKTCSENKVKESPVSPKFIWGFSGIMIAVFTASAIFYDSIIIRYLFVFMILAIVFVNRYHIINALKLVRKKDKQEN